LEQSQQPQTLGYSLADSPAGLLAWIYEKLVKWTDEYPWTDDEGMSIGNRSWSGCRLTSIYAVLTWISIYWFSRAGPAASTRIYYEYRNAIEEFVYLEKAPVLTGLSLFPKDLYNFPRTSVLKFQLFLVNLASKLILGNQ
jgi:hypothetical protein